jgi:hypothetical protein
MWLRNSRSGSIEGTSREAGADTHRRGGRGWGPSSGGQLTIIVVTFAVLLLFPVGAWALSFSNVAITDPGGVNQANVNGSGQLSAAGTGKVTAKVAYPTSAIVHSDSGINGPVVIPDDCASGSCVKLIAPPAGKALVVTSIHVDTHSDPNPGSTINITRSNDGTCSVASIDTRMEFVTPSGLGMTDVQYGVPGGMTIPTGKALCIQNSDPNLQVLMTAWGYAVASTAVPADLPAPGAPSAAAPLERQP